MIDPDCDLCQVFTRHEKTHGPTAQDILLGVLGGTYGGPSISHEDGMWTLYVWGDAPVGMEVMCRHEEWPEFIKLVAEYSDYMEGDSDG